MKFFPYLAGSLSYKVIAWVEYTSAECAGSARARNRMIEKISWRIGPLYVTLQDRLPPREVVWIFTVDASAS